MLIYRKAKLEDLKKIWDKDIANNLGEDCWIRWKEQYIEYNKTGKATTFVVLDENEPIGQITVLFSSDCSAVKNRPMLCNGKQEVGSSNRIIKLQTLKNR